MKRLNVKSTMLEWFLDHVAPHYCCSCGEIGALLCESCKYDIVSEPYVGCLLCGRLSLSGACSQCQPGIDRSWCGGERRDGLETLINRYKFEYARAAYEPLGNIILSTLPDLPENTVIVPIPTIRPHVRQRGYDHVLLVARYVAAKRHLTLGSTLVRRTATVQRGASRSARIAQAKEAFMVQGVIDPIAPYLLLDDVVTTGSTLRYAAQTLKDAGVTTVWAVAAARQTMD